MAATVPVFLKHTFIGKATQAQPYTARAHSRYIQRESATHSVNTHLMPDNYQARQRWFFDHENGLRKNGRVVDKFTITIPYGVTEEHARETLDRFGKWLGQERCPFMFTLQGFDTHNHHAHFVFIDRDVETGKRVYGTTEKNSTRGLKLEWEKVANAALEELGYDILVKVREPLEQEIANDNAKERDMPTQADSTPAHLAFLEDEIEDDASRSAVIARIIELEEGIDGADLSRKDCIRLAMSEYEDRMWSPDVENIETAYELRQTERLEESLDLDTLEATETVSEEPMAEAAVNERPEDADISTAGNNVRNLYAETLELNRLHQAQHDLQAARDTHASLLAQTETARLAAGEFYEKSLPVLSNADNRKREVEQYQKPNGKLKGLHVKLLGMEWRSPTRKHAENAIKEADKANIAAQYVNKKRAELDNETAQLAQAAEEAERDAYMHAQQLEATYGSDADIADAEKDMKATIQNIIQETDPREALLAYEAGDITAEELRQFAIHSGNKELLREIDSPTPNGASDGVDVNEEDDGLDISY